MGKSRDLPKKTGDIKGIFHARITWCHREASLESKHISAGYDILWLYGKGNLLYL